MVTSWLSEWLVRLRLDRAPAKRQPSILRVSLALIGALAGSLVADAMLVALGEAVFPRTKGYQHFQFGDYATLTIIGVLIAGLGWPILTRLSSQPRWIYGRLAIVVTIVLLLPDVWILHLGQPRDAVGVLMAMHLAVALVTYFTMVTVATSENE